MKKSNHNQSSPITYYHLIPHTNVLAQQKMGVTKNINFTHTLHLTHITQTKHNVLVHKKRYILRKKQRI